jgi:6-phosphogluconolactonase (cycloisomerase 2 family)
VYTESNDPSAGKNSVLALEYGPTGSTNPAHIREFRTKGTGAALIQPGMSVGTLGADQQVTLSPDAKWLFAVNQGSNTIAVFRVNKATGALTHVPGSPFNSGGNAPISIGYNGRYVVVANHGVKAPFVPGPMANFGNPNFVSFRVSSQGRLTKISSTPAGPGPTQAAISPSGKNVFSTSFYAFLPPDNKTIQSLTLSATGALAEAPGSPTGLPASVTSGVGPIPPFLPPGIERLAFGIATHPTKKYMYIAGPINAKVAIYGYNDAGALTFAGAENNPGSFAACWVVVTSDGKYLYTANSASQDISVFTVSANGADLTYVEKVKVPSTGTDLNLAIDPTNKYLYAIADHDDPDGPRPQGVMPDGTIVPAPADGNFLEAFKIGAGGRISSISTTALPVRLSQEPYGLAVLRKGG